MAAYYNEIDPEKAAWIRELIKTGVIAPGEVDERDIRQVRADDLRGFKQCHFFAGIAVWSYALRLAGWPDDQEVWTGSCPCPSFSAAGKGQGFDDARHLWPAWWPLIRESRPSTIFGEQVAAAIRHGWWDLVSTDLESEAYAVAAAVLTSAGVGGPDIRERLYWLAHSECNGGRSDIEIGRQEGRTTDRRDSEAVRLADTAARGRGMLRSAPGSTGHAESSDETGRLDDAKRARLEGCDGTGDLELHRGAEPLRPVGETGSTGRLANADGGESWFGELQRSGEHGLVTPDSGNGFRHPFADALKGFWGDADWLFCTDGKWRPVEAKPQPMADGAADDLGRVRNRSSYGFALQKAEEEIGFPLGENSPARLMRLRGYGDAINSQVAAEFIRAVLETEAHRVEQETIE